MDREAWRAAVPGVAKSWTQLSDWTELNLRTQESFPVCIYLFIFGSAGSFFAVQAFL